MLYKSKITSEYTNGSKTVKTIEKPVMGGQAVLIEPSIDNDSRRQPTPVALPANNGFWSSISCFFKRLFGGNC